MTNFNYDNLPALSEVGLEKQVLLVDLETSGWKSDIPETCTLSIGAVLVGTDGEITSEFYRVICPSDDKIEAIRPGATETNGLTEDILRSEGIPTDEAWKEFADWLKEHGVSSSKTWYIGQNPRFDLAFIEAEAPQLVRKYGWVPDRVLDIIDLYSVTQSKFIVPHISNGRSRKGKGANNLAKALQVPGEPDIHNALEGARLNYRNWSQLVRITHRWKAQKNT
jgi:DNA polymerase III epsilon subunit-like protein